MQTQFQNTKSLVSSLPIVAAALGKKHGINVVINRRATTAATDGKTIFLPEIPDTDEAIILARGYIDHESAHIRHTDFDVPFPKGIGHSILNILEDIRIELLLGRELPGCRINLEALESYFVDNDMYDVIDEGSHPHAILIARIHHCLRVDVLGNECTKALADNAYALYKSVLPAELTDQIDHLLANADQIRDTKHAAEISEAIVALIRNASPEEPGPENPEEKDQSSQQEGDGSDQSDDSQKSQQAGSPGESNEEESGPDSNSGSNPDDSEPSDSDANSGGKSDQVDEKGDADEKSGTPAQGGNGQDEDDEEPGSSSPRQSIKQSDADPEEEGGTEANKADSSSNSKSSERRSEGLKQLQDALDKKSEQSDLGDKVAEKLKDLSFAAKMNGQEVVTMPVIKAHELLLNEAMDPSEVSRETNALRTRLNGLIQASKRKRSPPRRSGSRVDTSSLHRLSFGDHRIFRSREEKPAVNTGIVVLVDQSSSMSKISRLTTQCTMAISLALDSVQGVKLAIGGFSSRVEPDGVQVSAYVAPSKLFNQRTNRQSFVPRASGGTPLTEGLLWAASELLGQKEINRRIVIVLTDGRPDDAKTSIDILRKMKLASIETYGIGIQHEISPVLIPNSSSITNVQELAPTVFELLQGILVGD